MLHKTPTISLHCWFLPTVASGGTVSVTCNPSGATSFSFALGASACANTTLTSNAAQVTVNRQPVVDVNVADATPRSVCVTPDTPGPATVELTYTVSSANAAANLAVVV